MVLLRLVAPARFAKRVVAEGLADIAVQTGGMALVAAAIRQARRQAVQQSARSKFVVCERGPCRPIAAAWTHRQAIPSTNVAAPSAVPTFVKFPDAFAKVVQLVVF